MESCTSTDQKCLEEKIIDVNSNVFNSRIIQGRDHERILHAVAENYESLNRLHEEFNEFLTNRMAFFSGRHMETHPARVFVWEYVYLYVCMNVCTGVCMILNIYLSINYLSI